MPIVQNYGVQQSFIPQVQAGGEPAGGDLGSVLIGMICSFVSDFVSSLCNSKESSEAPRRPGGGGYTDPRDMDSQIIQDGPQPGPQPTPYQPAPNPYPQIPQQPTPAPYMPAPEPRNFIILSINNSYKSNLILFFS